MKSNYLNNKDILKEIHKSKNTYCYYTKPEYHRYDLIVDIPHESLEKSFEHILKSDSIQLARENRAARLSVESGTKISPDDSGGRARIRFSSARRRAGRRARARWPGEQAGRGARAGRFRVRARRGGRGCSP